MDSTVMGPSQCNRQLRTVRRPSVPEDLSKLGPGKGNYISDMLESEMIVPTEVVSLHDHGEEEELGEQIGDLITVTKPARIAFPPYHGPTTFVQVAAWKDGEPIAWTTLTNSEGRPMPVGEGDVVSVVAPFTATFSDAS